VIVRARACTREDVGMSEYAGLIVSARDGTGQVWRADQSCRVRVLVFRLTILHKIRSQPM
jgi:hypothetical protein